MGAGNNIVRVALSATLVVFSIIVMGLSAKLINDGVKYNKLLKQAAANYSSLGSNTFGLGSFGTGSTIDTIDTSDLIKRDYRIGSYIFFNAPVPAYALDLTVALISIIAGVAGIALSFMGSLTALICVIIDGVLVILWLVAMAYSAHAFDHAGLFTSLDIFQIPKADFAFVVLSFLVSLTLVVLSALAFFGIFGGHKEDNAPVPPAAADNEIHDTTGAVHQEQNYGIPQQTHEKPQETMNVPV